MNRRKTLKYLDRVLNAHDKQGILSNPIKYLKYNSKNIPTRLYKFRECTELDFENLEKENIYLRRASDFSDLLDVSLLFDSINNISSKKIIELYKKDCLRNYIDNFYTKFDADDLDITPFEVKQILTKAYDDEFRFDHSKVVRCIRKISMQYAKKEMSYKNASKSNKEIRKARKECFKTVLEAREKMAEKLNDIFSKHGHGQKLIDYCLSYYKQKIDNIKEFIKKETFVYSLSDNNKNLSMWEKYADYHSGFCVEYTVDIEKSLDSFMRNENEIKLLESIFNLFKVNYIDFSKQPPILSTYKYLCNLADSSTKGHINSYRKSKISALVAYHKLLKDNDFKFEREWRIVLFHVENQLIHFPLTSAIYIGRNVSDSNYNRLVEIAGKLQVPAYKQVFNDRLNTYNYELITEIPQ